MKKFDLILKSKRNSDLYTTIIESEKEVSGLIIFVHGFKADRTEGNRFIEVGEALAKNGFNSIMCSFAGCGDSKEDFINYHISNCLDDIDVIYEYMLENYQIDKNRLAMVGYSMGGRLTSIYTNIHKEFKVIGLWAAATYNDFDNEEEFLDNNINKMEAEANEKGYALAFNSFDHEYLKLSKKFFDDMYFYKPFDYLKEYKGALILVHGDADITVKLDVSKKAYENAMTNNKKLVIVKDANHGFGLWDNHMEQSKQLVDETIKFIQKNLC